MRIMFLNHSYEPHSKELEPAIGVPIVNTKAVGVAYAELMVRSRISHSIKALSAHRRFESGRRLETRQMICGDTFLKEGSTHDH